VTPDQFAALQPHLNQSMDTILEHAEGYKPGKPPSGGVGEAVLQRWRRWWQEAKSDAAWLEEQQRIEAARRASLPEFRKLAQRLAKGGRLEDFKSEFDGLTKSVEGRAWGLGGTDGAMTFNQLWKNLPSRRTAVQRRLAVALRTPSSDKAAQAQI